VRGSFACCLLALFTACDFGSGDVDKLLNSCADAADCLEGACEDGLCVDDSGRSVEVVVEVLRSAADTQGLTPQRWAYEPVSLAGSSVRDYVLPRTREVIGAVRLGDVEVPAEIRFSRRMEQPFLGSLPSASVKATTLRQPLDLPGEDLAHYQTKLVAGASYDVVIAPTSDVLVDIGKEPMPALRILPPLYLDDVLVDEAEGVFRLDVSFPSALVDDCRVEALTGCTLHGSIVSTNGIVTTTEPGLQVRAVEVGSGRLVSSIAETDERGSFSIRVSAQAGEYRVRVTSVPGAEPFPSVLFDPTELFSEPTEELDVTIPRLRRVRFSGRIIDADDRPVPNAALRLTSDSIFDDVSVLLGQELMGSFTATGQTDLDGRFSVELLPGAYQVVVTPPASEQNTWGVRLTQALVTEAGSPPDDALYSVPTQIAFSGAVLALGVEPAAGVSVLAKPRVNVSDSPVLEQTDLARSPSPPPTTNRQGKFRTHLDAGRFDVSVRPDFQTGFPWIVEPDLDFSEVQSPQTRSYSLPAPIVARGMITASDGSAVSGAQVRAYRFVGEGDERRAVQIAETDSDENGNYRLLIAPALGGE
jgi:hypothetical protein